MDRLIASLIPSCARRGAALLASLAFACSASAQSEGGLYIAGAGFSFQQAAERGIAQNPNGQRFFLLAVPPAAAALTSAATSQAAALRARVVAAGGVLLVCQRDIDNGSIDPSTLASGVVPVRGFPPPGSNAIPDGGRYFPGENPANLPASNDALRRLRATCS
jgi:hypothetical protein